MQLFLAVLLEAVLETAVGQLGDDQELPFDDLDPLEREQERVPHPLDAIEGFQLAGRAVFVQEAIDELDRLDQLARGFGGPDFAVAAGADPLHELVAWNRLVVDFSALAVGITAGAGGRTGDGGQGTGDGGRGTGAAGAVGPP